MKRLKYLIFLLLMPFVISACSDDDNEGITDEEYVGGKAVVNLTVLDAQSQLPVSGVNLRQTNLKISAVTDENGKAVVELNPAPRAIANLVLSHDAYDTYTTSVAIGEIAEGATKNVNVELVLSQQTVSYVVTFTVLDDSTYLPIEGVAVLGLETGAEGTDADGVANVKVPGPGDYKFTLGIQEYDTTYVSVTVPDEGLPGETVTVDAGTILMVVSGGFRVKEVDLSTMSWNLDSMKVESRERGEIGTEILTKAAFLEKINRENPGDAHMARFNRIDFDYIIAASNKSWSYPLVFKVHYEEASYAPGCYRVEVVSFLEPFEGKDSDLPTKNRIDTDESYYDYKKKTLVFHFDIYEAWCNTQGWDTYIYSSKE